MSYYFEIVNYRFLSYFFKNKKRFLIFRNNQLLVIRYNIYISVCKCIFWCVFCLCFISFKGYSLKFLIILILLYLYLRVYYFFFSYGNRRIICLGFIQLVFVVYFRYSERLCQFLRFVYYGGIKQVLDKLLLWGRRGYQIGYFVCLRRFQVCKLLFKIIRGFGIF